MMMEELATVIAINQDKITVQSQIKSACSGCQQVDNCGSGQVAKAIPQRKLTLEIVSTLPMRVGDTVVLGVPEQALTLVAAQVYLFPLAGLIIGAGLGQWLVEQGVLAHELYAIAFGAIGGYLGYRLAHWRQKITDKSSLLTPKILSVKTA